MLESLYPLIEVARFRRRYDDDFVDRLNCRYTTLLLISLSIIITGCQTMLEPISCWTPAQFTHEWIEYANKICWVSNTYYVPMDKLLPNPDEPRYPQIAYYQWVPFAIFAQAILFIAPNVFWKAFNSRGGIHVNKLVALVDEVEKRHAEPRSRVVRFIARAVDRALRSQKEYRRSRFARCRQVMAMQCCLFCGKRYGNYLVALYICVKLLYVCSNVAQLFLLNSFLGAGFHMYGIQVVRDIVRGKNLESSSRFPRVTMCDFDIRSLGNQKHTYTVQCALQINLFNEKVYTLIWFWLVFVLLVTLANLTHWIWTLPRRNRAEYVRKCLRTVQRYTDKEEKVCTSSFLDDYLRQDGVFLLRLMSLHANDVAIGEIVDEMWQNYKRRVNERRPVSEV